jgi:phosphoesterase RecJ-like protein
MIFTLLIILILYFCILFKKKDILTTENIEKAEQVIARAKRVVIVSHYNPDGDAVGASLALYHFFANRKIQVNIILPNDIPEFLEWMPAYNTIIIAQNNFKKADSIIKKADLLFFVDMNATHRSGAELEKILDEATAFKILIDHHPEPNIDCDIIYSSTKTSSTCELIYNFLFKYLNKKEELTLEIAECIYVGIMTDTGSFSYMCNNPNTFLILAELMKLKVDGEKIHRNVYDNYSIARIKLLGLLLCKRLTVLPEFATSYMYLTKKDMLQCNYKRGDTEGFVNYGLSMKIVKFTAFFIERDNRVRISFRSKGNFNVNNFAKKHFGGGGHRNASAAYYEDSLENTIAYFNQLLPLYAEELNS